MLQCQLLHVSEITCDVPLPIANTTMMYQDFIQGSVVTFVCNEGFQQTDGDNNKTCIEDEEWEGQDIVCEGSFV